MQPATLKAPAARVSRRRRRPATQGRVCHVAFLSARSGGGHHGTAHALAAWMERAGTRTRADIIDIYGGGLRALPWLASVRQRSNLIWWAFTAIMGWSPVLRLSRAVLRPFVVQRCLRALPRRPDLLVATHFMPAQFMREIAAHFDPPPPTLTIASDYEPHRAWFGNADLMIVSDPSAIERAAACGVSADRLFSVPLLPARPAQTTILQATPARVDRALRLCAVMGADGTSGGRLLAVLDALERDAGAGVRIHIEVICGRNQQLQDELARRAALYQHVAVTVTGFVDDVPARLAAADAALLRASPLVLTEALAQGRPVLAFDWHAHEGAAVRLLERWGSGHASRRPEAIAARILSWVACPAELARTQRHARRLADRGFDESTVRAVLARAERRAA